MSLAEAPMTTRQALVASERITPNVLEATIAKQREQLKDQMRIADAARSRIDGESDLEDVELWATAARNAADIVRCLSENLEMEAMSHIAVVEAPSERLTDELVKRAKNGERAEVVKLLSATLKKLSKKEPARGAR